MKQISLYIILGFIFIISSHCFAQITYESADTLIVRGRCVVFYEPSASDLDSLMLKNEPVLKTLADFRHYSAMIISFLNKKMIPVLTTDKNDIILQLGSRPQAVIHKAQTGSYMGIILSDGKKDPLLLPGVTGDTDFFLKYKRFFETK